MCPNQLNICKEVYLKILETIILMHYLMILNYAVLFTCIKPERWFWNSLKQTTILLGKFSELQNNTSQDHFCNMFSHSWFQTLNEEHRIRVFENRVSDCKRKIPTWAVNWISRSLAWNSTNWAILVQLPTQAQTFLLKQRMPLSRSCDVILSATC